MIPLIQRGTRGQQGYVLNTNFQMAMSAVMFLSVVLLQQALPGELYRNQSQTTGEEYVAVYR
jgi:hypothetical protein